MTNLEMFKKASQLVNRSPDRTIKDVLKEVGISASTYQYYKKKEKSRKNNGSKKTKAPEVITYNHPEKNEPLQDESGRIRCFIFDGNAQDIANILRGM